MLSSSTVSSIFGWISIACWIVVYSPQIYENYTLQSGEGLSLLFVFIWLLGDLGNLFGALTAGLLPTMIILGSYYTLCDTTLLFQIYYYRWKRGRSLWSSSDDDERTPLLIGGTEQPESKLLSTRTIVTRYTAALLFVVTAGLTAWWVSGEAKEDKRTAPELPDSVWWKSQILGWSSAIFFIGARIPQIIKNFSSRCEGLSPALFFFAICGNTTYTMSILAKSTDKEYLLTNASWLAGSSLIVFMDIFVLCQFMYYRMQERRLRGI